MTGYCIKRNHHSSFLWKYKQIIGHMVGFAMVLWKNEWSVFLLNQLQLEFSKAKLVLKSM